MRSGISIFPWRTCCRFEIEARAFNGADLGVLFPVRFLSLDYFFTRPILFFFPSFIWSWHGMA